MKANELRIGNLIEKDGKPFKVTLSSIQEMKRVNFNPSLFKPLRLNSMLLYKLGFIFNDQTHEYRLLADINNKQEWIFSLIVKDGFFQTYVSDIKVEFVHHLQNIVYSLKGYELKFADITEEESDLISKIMQLTNNQNSVAVVNAIRLYTKSITNP